jgi:hypothetical protein
MQLEISFVRYLICKRPPVFQPSNAAMRSAFHRCPAANCLRRGSSRRHSPCIRPQCQIGGRGYVAQSKKQPNQCSNFSTEALTSLSLARSLVRLLAASSSSSSRELRPPRDPNLPSNSTIAPSDMALFTQSSRPSPRNSGHCRIIFLGPVLPPSSLHACWFVLRRPVLAHIIPRSLLRVKGLNRQRPPGTVAAYPARVRCNCSQAPPWFPL